MSFPIEGCEKELYNIIKKKVKFNSKLDNPYRDSAYCTSCYCPFYRIIGRSCRIFESFKGERSKKYIELFGE